MKNDELSLMHALVLTKLYDEFKANKKPIIIELENGNKEHSDTIGTLVDLGFVHVMPDGNRLLLHITDEGLKMMKLAERVEGIIGQPEH